MKRKLLALMLALFIVPVWSCSFMDAMMRPADTEATQKIDQSLAKLELALAKTNALIEKGKDYLPEKLSNKLDKVSSGLVEVRKTTEMVKEETRKAPKTTWWEYMLYVAGAILGTGVLGAGGKGAGRIAMNLATRRATKKTT